jgi:subtilisin family serine protease
MKTRFSYLLLRAVLLSSTMVSAAMAQPGNKAKRFEVLTDDLAVAAKRLRDRPLTVVLKLAAEPVAVVRARSPDKQISEGEQGQIENQLRQQQDALVPMIQSIGGEVLGQFQNAINGIKVRATRERIAEMARLPGVVEVKPVLTHELNNAISVPFIEAPEVWGTAAMGFRGEGIKIAIIDTGVDYTHANFAGPGTVAAFQEADKHSTEPADPLLFGPNAPKVKGGTDLVGDDYNSSDPKHDVPHPDPNPLDCNGHGSHVSGTAAGFGVKPDGTTFFPGPYTSGTPGQPFRIGPGVAPGADLYAVRVFGCTGSTEVVVEALDWALKNGMDVISMSLGADFGSSISADSEASTNAAAAGVIVVAAAGNAGQSAFFTGSPASADKVLSVAAIDSNTPPVFPAANIALSPGPTVKAQISNGASLPTGSLPVVVLPSDGTDPANGLPYSGCVDATWAAANVAGKLVVTERGFCDRVARATFGQKYSAKVVVLINNSGGYPPLEGSIPGVTIPFLGALRSDRTSLRAATSATLTPTTIPNPGYHKFASFSSGGPRNHDSALKPDITAPGVSVVSTLSGTGNLGAAFSGTSMATPHVSGAAALALQSHPGWDPDDVRRALANTADPSKVVDYSVRVGGSGVVQVLPATETSVVAIGTNEAGSLSFGLAEFSTDFVGSRTLRVKNLGSSPQSFTASYSPRQGSPHSVTVSPQNFNVGGGQSIALSVQLSVPAATSGNAQGGGGLLRQVSGLVTLTPNPATGNHGVSLRVPYYLVPRARSEIHVALSNNFSPDPEQGTTTVTATVQNTSPKVAGTADFYAWGLAGTNKNAGEAGIRGVGVQSFDITTGDPCGTGPCLLVFAVNIFNRWSTPVVDEYDILIDANNDGIFDYAVVSVPQSSGRMAAVLYDLKTGKPAVPQTGPFFAEAVTNNSTMLLPVVAGDMGITRNNPRFTYGAEGFDGWTGAFDSLGETPAGRVAADAAKFNAYTNALNTGDFAVVPPNGTVTVPLTINSAEFARTPALGVMSISLDNFSGPKQSEQRRIGGGEEDNS